jgi:hypothetical protein
MFRIVLGTTWKLVPLFDSGALAGVGLWETITMAEITFETFRLALEASRGTAEAAPTHLINLEGTLTPKITRYRPREARGTRVRNYRSVDTRRASEFELEGDLDSVLAPLLFNMAVKPNSSPATPSGASTARLWAHVGAIAADDIKTATCWWGDPNLTDQLKSGFAFIDELTVENDASGEEVATVNVKGMAGPATKVSAPSATAAVSGVTYPGQLMQVWIDTGSDTIGTTEVAGRVISAKHTIRTGAKAKYLAQGPDHNLGMSKIGRDKIVAITTELKLELEDFDQYDQWEAADILKVRVRHNGKLIETTVDPTDLFHFVEFDCYGPASDLEWDDNEGVNRAIKLVIEGQYDGTLASDIRVACQNDRSSL